MLKKIPAEQLDEKDILRIKKNKRKRAHNRAPNSKLQKKSSITLHAESKVIRLVGMKLSGYGKYNFKTHEEFQKLIRDAQISVLLLQKQQRRFIKEMQDKKKK